MINNTEEFYSAIDENKEYNFALLKSIKDVFDEALSAKEYAKVCLVPQMIDTKRLFMTGEMSRIRSLLKIYADEREMGCDCFLEDTESFDSLYSKYLKTVLMLRRIEQFSEQDLLSEAYEYLSNIKLSPVALIMILQNEYYEKRKGIAFAYYKYIKNSLSENEERVWIKCFSKAGYLDE